MTDNFPYSETAILVRTRTGSKVHLGWKNGSTTACKKHLRTVGDNLKINGASPHVLCQKCFPQAEDSIPVADRERLGIVNRSIEPEKKD